MNSLEITAPVRVDFAGGTLDIYPLYLLLESAFTLNVSLELKVKVKITEGEKLHKITSCDLNKHLEFGNETPIIKGDLESFQRAVKFFSPTKTLNITLSSPLPAGSGLGASSALLIALMAGLNKITEKNYSFTELIDYTANIEAQSLKTLTGKQDYIASVYGGINFIKFGLKGWAVEALEIQDFYKTLEDYVILYFTGKSHSSGKVNWEVVKAFLDGKPSVISAFKEIKKITKHMKEAFITKDIQAIAYWLNAESNYRKSLYTTIYPVWVEEIINDVKKLGGFAAKVCGAGGGGSILFIVPPINKEKVINYLQDNKGGGGEVLPFKITPEGIKIISSKKEDV